MVAAAGGSSRAAGLGLRPTRAPARTRYLGAERQGKTLCAEVFEVKISEDLMDLLVDIGFAARIPGRADRVA